MNKAPRHDYAARYYDITRRDAAIISDIMPDEELRYYVATYEKVTFSSVTPYTLATPMPR